MKSPYYLLLSLLSLLIAACSYAPPVPVAVSPVEAPVSVKRGVSAPVPSNPTRARILLLFERADGAMAAQNLTSPEGESAWDHYREILDLVPGNDEAERGLVNIVDRYIQWSDAALRQGRREPAHAYLQRAARVKPDHPALLTRLERVAGQSPGERYVALDPAQLNERSEAIQRQLATLADEIRGRHARVVIEAPSDRQGRWIYQQLNGRHENYRIRANMQLKQQPALRLMD